MMKISEIKQKYPHPDDSGYVDGGYCVGDAFCKAHSDDFKDMSYYLCCLAGLESYPDPGDLGLAIAKVYGIKAHKATMAAIDIVTYNDNGEFDKAWAVLEQLEEETTNGRSE